jgi:hypothetical protein
MELINIHDKGYSISVILNGFSYINLNTITNTVTIQKTSTSQTANSTFDTAVTIKKQIPTQLSVNNKK